MKPVVIVGAGWSGAVVADRLVAADVPVEVLERGRTIGGHARVESLCGVTYEPNGPHILHTDNERVAAFFARLRLDTHPFTFCPLTEIELHDRTTRLMSWPIQRDELEDLPDWPQINTELNARPAVPHGDDFETYAVSLMGRRLYELFIEGYTRKQWGRDPSELSSSFAPKRIDLRGDGRRGLFRDRWQYWPRDGVNGAIESLCKRAAVTCGADVSAFDLVGTDASAIVVTAALDDFAGADPLAWRGVHLRSQYRPTESNETITPAYVINRPASSVPYTRTIETKHASGQSIYGSVVSEEHPSAPAKHYPVATVDHTHERANVALQTTVRAMLAPVPAFFCGRLAEYRYINQDEAILGAWACADALLGEL